MRRKPAIGYLYITPLLVGIAIFSIYPFFSVLFMSFHEIALADLATRAFVGLRNYKTLLTATDPSMGAVLRTTFVFVAGSVVFHISIGLGLALLLNIRWLKGRAFFRNVYTIPWITAGLLVGYTWSFLFEPRAGILNYLLSLIGIPSVSWTADPRLALPLAIIANVWKGVPFALILQTAGLQSIDPELYDAAVVDGAKAHQRLLRITLPLIAQFLLLNLILDTSSTFHVFDTIFALTGGGPVHRTEVLSLYLYFQAFSFGRIGLGAAVGVFMLCISVLLSIVYLRVFRPEVDRHG
jgi:multiple sugar transport system permease protein